jgi:hypothetical protein
MSNRVEIDTTWNYPILKTLEEDGSTSYYYPLCLSYGNAPELIKGRPVIMMQKNFRVTIFIPDGKHVIPYLLSVNTDKLYNSGLA